MRTRLPLKQNGILMLLFAGLLACGSPTPDAHQLQGEPENVKEADSHKNDETEKTSQTKPDGDGHRKVMACESVESETTYDIYMGMRTPEESELPEGLKMLAGEPAVWFFITVDEGEKITEILKDERGFLHTENEYLHHYYRRDDQVRVLNVKQNPREDGRVEGYVSNFDLANDQETGPNSEVICEDLIPTPGGR